MKYSGGTGILYSPYYAGWKEFSTRRRRTTPRSMAFSKRTAWDTTESALAAAVRQAQSSGRPFYDLTASNPTRCGFHYDAAALLEPLSNPAALLYDPDPRGMRTARQAVSRYYQHHGAILDPQIFLTTSTSEAYSYLFRLLCDSGDEVLIAQPSYPLFDFLATLDDVRLVPFSMVYDHGWQIDPEAIRRQITARTRAIALVHPNNPTGHFTKAWERRILEEICSEHGLALIVDEVFLDYPLGDSAGREANRSFAAGEHPVLTFVLSGLSKIAGLPQMKAAWIVCLGPEPECRPAEDRLEFIADTFLSVNAPIQCAIPQWLEGREGIQRQILDRVTGNLAVLDRMLEQQSMIVRQVVEGGWYAVLRIPALRHDEETAIHLLQSGVSVHPGYFFGLPPSGWLVVSLLTEPSSFSTGISVLEKCI
jgi:alanine-synthesizing transaminase